MTDKGVATIRAGKRGGKNLDTQIARLERLLINFDAERARIVAFWKTREAQFLAENLRNDAYIMHEVCEVIENNTPKIAFKKLSLHIRRCHSPLFRDYYKKAREDISRLRKVEKQHASLLKMREKKETLDAIRRTILAGEETIGVLPAQSVSKKGTGRVVAGVPNEEVSNYRLQ